MQLAENTGQKITQKSPSVHHHTTLPGYIFANKACIDNQKKVVKQQYFLQTEEILQITSKSKKLYGCRNGRTYGSTVGRTTHLTSVSLLGYHLAMT